MTFRYNRTPTGELPGNSLITQTEAALSALSLEATEAKEAAQAAQTAAEDAASQASAAASSAAASQAAAEAAAQSAAAGQQALVIAQRAETAAGQAVTTATAAATAAQAAQTDAENAASDAQDAADLAAQSAQDAQTAQGAASESQTAAESAQTSAGQAATIATQAQSAAAQSAQSAAQAAATVAASARQIGEIVTSTLPLSTVGLHLLDGAILDGDGIYAAFVEYVANLDQSANYFCTEAEWQQSITDSGMCGKFVYDSVNETVRLPKLDGAIVQGDIDIDTLGDLVTAGLDSSAPTQTVKSFIYIVIANSVASSTPVDLDEIVEKALNAVTFTAQTLTDAQKEQARANIGAGTVNQAELDAVRDELRALEGAVLTATENAAVAYSKPIPTSANLFKYAAIQSFGGRSIVWNQLVDSSTSTVTLISGRKYITVVSGIWTLVTGDGSSVSVSPGTDQVFDLTLMFGAGNEPATVADFRAIFPSVSSAFNEGEIKSAGVNKIVSRGKNLADYSKGQGYPSDTASSNSTKRIFEIGKYVVGLTASNYYAPPQVASLTVADDSISLVVSSGGYGVGIPFECTAGSAYTASFVASGAGTETNPAWISWYGQDGNYLSYSNSIVNATAPSGAVQGVLVLRPVPNLPATYSNIQIEKASAATAYSAPFKIDTPIPAEILALPGYGWSAGTAYNEVDWENKKYIQRVGRVVLDGTQKRVTTAIDSIRCTVAFEQTDIATSSGNDQNVVSDYLPANSYPNMRNDGEQGIILAIIGGQKALYTSLGKDSGISDVTQYLAYLSAHPLTVNYELETPIETDISALIDDNTIEVESGGSITFENALGDSYRIPVPNSLVTMEKP